MNKTSSTTLVVFAREPKEGKVKTRLLKNFSTKVVTSLYQAFVKDVLNIARCVDVDERFLFYHGAGAHIPFLRKHSRSFTLKRQMGENLGERMDHALKFCKQKGFDRIIIMGSDCVTLTPKLLKEAFNVLKQVDCVLGPATDGGYYLIGLKRTDLDIFKGIAWGSQNVLRQTCEKLTKKKQSFRLLIEKADIDTPEDLRKVGRDVQRKKAPQYTFSALKKIDF